MKPINYTKTNNKITFHYKYSDLKYFLQRGFEFGDCGWLLLSYDNGIKVYKGFGTIEHPMTELITISLLHSDIADGGTFNPDEIIYPNRRNPLMDNYSYKILDFSESKFNENETDNNIRL